MKKNIAETPYMMPIFLWSTVKSQDFHPDSIIGRLKPPRLVPGLATAGAAMSVLGRSMIAMIFSDHFRVKR
jgi:hypothetical protein